VPVLRIVDSLKPDPGFFLNLNKYHHEDPGLMTKVKK
jgi:hypothetical protein